MNQVKMFNSYTNSLQNDINDWMRETNYEIKEIVYSTCFNSRFDRIEYSALIRYTMEDQADV